MLKIISQYILFKSDLRENLIISSQGIEKNEEEKDIDIVNPQNMQRRAIIKKK